MKCPAAARPAVEPLEPRRLLAAGALDAGFGDNGVVAVDLAGNPQRFQSLNAGDEVGGGDLLFAGFSSNASDGSDPARYLLRLNADGTRDNAFDGDGILVIPQSDPRGGAGQILGLADGDALVVRFGGGATPASVERLNPDGTPDAAFGNGGFVDFPDFTPIIALLPSGGFVAVGAVGDAGSTQFGRTYASSVPVRAFDADGSPSGVNPTGDALAGASFDGFRPEDVAVDSAGRVYVGGDVYIDNNPQTRRVGVGVLRLNPDLARDGDYGVGGLAQYEFSNIDLFGTRSLSLGADNRALLTVGEDDGENTLVRFTANGLVDNAPRFRFNASGGFNDENAPVRLVAQSDGKLLVGGDFSENSPTNVNVTDAAFARFNADFTPDSSFGNGNLGTGQQRYFPSDAGDDFVSDLFLSDNGTAVAFGYSKSFDADARQTTYTTFAFRIDLGADAGGPVTPPAPAFATLDDNNSLNVVGTGANDTITVATEGREVVVTRTNNLGASDTIRFPDQSQILRTNIDAMDGNDSVRYDLAAPSTILGGRGFDTLVGGPGSDVLSGGRDPDSLVGGDGDDTLDGGEGDDLFFAENGADRYIGGAGSDGISYESRSAAVRLSPGNGQADDGADGEGDFISGDIEAVTGGSGDDQITAGPGVRFLDGGAGDDAFTDADGDQNYTGGDGNDTFVKVAGNDFFNGGAGDDAFVMASVNDGADDFYGGDGIDTADYSKRTAALSLTGVDGRDGQAGEGDTIHDADVIIGGAGDDTIGGAGLNDGDEASPVSVAAPVTLRGGGGNDVLTGANTTDSLDGGAGDDLLDGFGGDDTLDGGDGDDTLRARVLGNVLRGGDGNDFADFDFFNDPGIRIVVGGTRRADAAFVDDGAERVRGTEDDDLIDASDAAGPVTLLGGGDTAADTLIGSRFDDVLVGEQGDDSLVGGGGLDRLEGGPGADFLDGGDDNDKLLPGLDPGEGDTVVGGDGFDLIDYRASTADLNLTRGTLEFPPDPASNNGPGPAVSQDVELAFGGAGDDLIVGFIVSRGGDGNDQIRIGGTDDAAAYGEGGDDDILSGVVGRTYLDGGPGDDKISGGPNGDDTIAMGQGRDDILDVSQSREFDTDTDTDTLIFSAATEGVTVDLRNTNNVLGDGSPLGSASGTFRDVLGSPFADTIVGDDLNNYLNGGAGDDTILGNGGKDVLVGGGGRDSLDGGDDFDFLFAFRENDTDDRGAIDTLFGGGGFDVGFGSAEDDRDVERFAASTEELANLL